MDTVYSEIRKVLDNLLGGAIASRAMLRECMYAKTADGKRRLVITFTPAHPQDQPDIDVFKITELLRAGGLGLGIWPQLSARRCVARRCQPRT